MELQISSLKTPLVKVGQNKTSSKFQFSSSAISEKSFQDESESNSNRNKDDSNLSQTDKNIKAKFSRAQTKKSPVPITGTEEILPSEMAYSKQKTELMKEIEHKPTGQAVILNKHEEGKGVNFTSENSDIASSIKENQVIKNKENTKESNENEFIIAENLKSDNVSKKPDRQVSNPYVIIESKETKTDNNLNSPGNTIKSKEIDRNNPNDLFNIGGVNSKNANVMKLLDPNDSSLKGLIKITLDFN